MEWINIEEKQPEHVGIYLTTCRIHEQVEDEHWVEMLRWQEEDGIFFWQDLNTGKPKTAIAWMQKPKAYDKPSS